MKDIDNLIREALSAEDAKWFDTVDEPSLHEAMMESFRGKQSWVVRLAFVMMFVYLALAVFSAVKFFQADVTRDMIAWACGFMFSITTIAMLKVWYWMELNKIAVTREIKRFELQLARLSGRLGDNQ